MAAVALGEDQEEEDEGGDHQVVGHEGDLDDA